MIAFDVPPERLASLGPRVSRRIKTSSASWLLFFLDTLTRRTCPPPFVLAAASRVRLIVFPLDAFGISVCVCRRREQATLFRPETLLTQIDAPSERLPAPQGRPLEQAGNNNNNTNININNNSNGPHHLNTPARRKRVNLVARRARVVQAAGLEEFK